MKFTRYDNPIDLSVEYKLEFSQSDLDIQKNLIFGDYIWITELSNSKKVSDKLEALSVIARIIEENE